MQEVTELIERINDTDTHLTTMDTKMVEVLYDAFDKRIRSVLDWLVENDPKYTDLKHGHYDWYIDAGFIAIEGSVGSGCGCCDDESFYHSFNINILSDPDLKSSIEARVKAEADEEIRRSKEVADKKAADKLAADRKLFEKLQKKFAE